jgi:predicted nucleotidyltransferase
MDKNAVLEIIAKFKQILQKNGTRVDNLVLFGSYANGNPHEGSDIDLVVISRDFENKDFWERIEILTEAICEIFEPIEAIPMTPEEWERGDSMICEFAKQGEVIL